jgi:tetratricopeptide (TPR) repeat protein
MKLTPIQELEAQLREHPANPELYLAIVPLYLEKGRDYEAERLLVKGAAATEDPRVQFLREDLTMARLERSALVAAQHAEANGTPEAKAVLQQATAERDRFELEIFAARCQREPLRAALRYQWGLRLKRAGKLEEAARRFEEALSDPAQQPAAAFELGECQRQWNDVPEALRFYRLAAESAGGPEAAPEQLETKKQALWQAVGLATRVKLGRLAQRYLSELAQIDPRYAPAAAGVTPATATSGE